MAVSGFKGHPECRCGGREGGGEMWKPASGGGRGCCAACATCRRLSCWERCCALPLPPGRPHIDRAEHLPDLRALPCASPPRSFCRKRWYGENELFTHMHAAHEQCFLCRRSNPHKYVYYRDYPDLESERAPSRQQLPPPPSGPPAGAAAATACIPPTPHPPPTHPHPTPTFADHFASDHHLCPHPDCMEKKFVVFPTEQELKTHTARCAPRCPANPSARRRLLAGGRASRLSSRHAA